MKPVIALVGRPNVGKSTLFNRLTQSRDALVADLPGLTRDRQYGPGRVGDRPYLVVDTGGLTEGGDLEGLVAQQAYQAMAEADVTLFLVDGREGLTPLDQTVAGRLRQMGKPLFLVVNKAEGMAPELVGAEFHGLGLGEPHAVSAAHGDGINALMAEVLATLPLAEPEENEDTGARVAVVGRPNVGKSTLVNRMLGEERVLTFDMPGTTRDSIYIPFERAGIRYTLIDTAGVRRRGRVSDVVEKFSIVKTLQAIEDANVAVLLVDAREGIGHQDLGLLGFVLDMGRALIIAVNKWDGLAPDRRAAVKRELDRRLGFVDFASIHFISALHGTGVGALFESVNKAYASATVKLATPQLTRILEDAVNAHSPPLVHGRRIKLRYAHQGGHNPPLIVIHGNQTEAVPDSYRRYLANTYRKALRLEGTPVRIEFKGGRNPYQGRRNVLTPRQVRHKKRLMRHVRKS